MQLNGEPFPLPFMIRSPVSIPGFPRLRVPLRGLRHHQKASLLPGIQLHSPLPAVQLRGIMAAPHSASEPRHRALQLAAVDMSHDSETMSESDFRARGLKARGELTMVIGLESPGLAPVFIGGEAVAGDQQKLQEAGISHVRPPFSPPCLSVTAAPSPSQRTVLCTELLTHKVLVDV